MTVDKRMVKCIQESCDVMTRLGGVCFYCRQGDAKKQRPPRLCPKCGVGHVPRGQGRRVCDDCRAAHRTATKADKALLRMGGLKWLDEVQERYNAGDSLTREEVAIILNVSRESVRLYELAALARARKVWMAMVGSDDVSFEGQQPSLWDCMLEKADNYDD